MGSTFVAATSAFSAAPSINLMPLVGPCTVIKLPRSLPCRAYCQYYYCGTLLASYITNPNMPHYKRTTDAQPPLNDLGLIASSRLFVSSLSGGTDGVIFSFRLWLSPNVDLSRSSNPLTDERTARLSSNNHFPYPGRERVAGLLGGLATGSHRRLPRRHIYRDSSRKRRVGHS